MRVYVATTEYGETIIGVFSTAEAAWASHDSYGEGSSVDSYLIDNPDSWIIEPRP